MDTTVKDDDQTRYHDQSNLDNRKVTMSQLEALTKKRSVQF